MHCRFASIEYQHYRIVFSIIFNTFCDLGIRDLCHALKSLAPFSGKEGGHDLIEARQLSTVFFPENPQVRASELAQKFHKIAGLAGSV
jgi:hypothetical protein